MQQYQPLYSIIQEEQYTTTQLYSLMNLSQTRVLFSDQTMFHDTQGQTVLNDFLIVPQPVPFSQDQSNFEQVSRFVDEEKTLGTFAEFFSKLGNSCIELEAIRKTFQRDTFDSVSYFLYLSRGQDQISVFDFIKLFDRTKRTLKITDLEELVLRFKQLSGKSVTSSKDVNYDEFLKLLNLKKEKQIGLTPREPFSEQQNKITQNLMPNQKAKILSPHPQNRGGTQNLNTSRTQENTVQLNQSNFILPPNFESNTMSNDYYDVGLTLLFSKEVDIMYMVRSFKDMFLTMSNSQAEAIFQEISKDGTEIRSQDLVEFVHWRFRFKFGKQTGYQILKLMDINDDLIVDFSDFKEFFGIRDHVQKQNLNVLGTKILQIQQQRSPSPKKGLKEKMTTSIDYLDAESDNMPSLRIQHDQSKDSNHQQSIKIEILETEEDIREHVRMNRHTPSICFRKNLSPLRQLKPVFHKTNTCTPAPAGKKAQNVFSTHRSPDGVIQMIQMRNCIVPRQLHHSRQQSKVSDYQPVFPIQISENDSQLQPARTQLIPSSSQSDIRSQVGRTYPHGSQRGTGERNYSERGSSLKTQRVQILTEGGEQNTYHHFLHNQDLYHIRNQVVHEVSQENSVQQQLHSHVTSNMQQIDLIIPSVENSPCKDQRLSAYNTNTKIQTTASKQRLELNARKSPDRQTVVSGRSRNYETAHFQIQKGYQTAQDQRIKLVSPQQNVLSSYNSESLGTPFANPSQQNRTLFQNYKNNDIVKDKIQFYLSKSVHNHSVETVETEAAERVQGNIIQEQDIKRERRRQQTIAEDLLESQRTSRDLDMGKKFRTFDGRNIEDATQNNSRNSIQSEKDNLIADMYQDTSAVQNQMSSTYEVEETTRRILGNEGAFNQSEINRLSPTKLLVNDADNNESLYQSVNDQEEEFYEENEDLHQLQISFVSYLLQIISGEKELNAYKANLLDNTDFDIVECFQAISSFYEESTIDGIPSEALYESFREVFGIGCSFEDINLLLASNDICFERGSLFRFQDFSKLIMPSSHLIHYIRDLLEKSSKKITYETLWDSDRIPDTVTEDLQNAICTAIEHEKELERLRSSIFNCQVSESLSWSSNLQLLFENLDSKGKNSLSKSKLQNLLIEKGNYFASQREINHLFNRFDKQMKGCIEIDDFINELRPRFCQVDESILEPAEYEEY